jgi:hypothetical protein
VWEAEVEAVLAEGVALRPLVVVVVVEVVVEEEEEEKVLRLLLVEVVEGGQEAMVETHVRVEQGVAALEVGLA